MKQLVRTQWRRVGVRVWACVCVFVPTLSMFSAMWRLVCFCVRAQNRLSARLGFGAVCVCVCVCVRVYMCGCVGGMRGRAKASSRVLYAVEGRGWCV